MNSIIPADYIIQGERLLPYVDSPFGNFIFQILRLLALVVSNRDV